MKIREKGKYFIWPALLAVTILLFAGLTACGTGSDDEWDSSNHGLVRCENCSDLKSWLVATATVQMRFEMEANRGGGYYGDDTGDAEDSWDDDDDWAGDDDAVADDDDAFDDDDSDMSDDDAASDDDDQASGDENAGDDDDDEDHSDTNTQESGVDEADIIKTDGERLFILAGGYLMLFDPDPAPQTAELSRIEITGTPLEMYIYQDVVLVFSFVSHNNLPDDIWPGVPEEDLSWNITKITLIDYSDSANPTLLREAYLEGEYISSRRIDASARIVLFSEPNSPEYDSWVDTEEYCDWETGECDQDAIDEAYDELYDENRDKIEEQGLDEWLPRYHQIIHSGENTTHEDLRLAECSNNYHPQNPRGFGFLTVMTVMLNDPQTKQPDIALVADRGTVYSSSDSLVVAEDEDMAWDWNMPEEDLGDDDDDETNPESVSEIHMFDIASDPNQAVYKASGAVPGFVLNQFSMGEYDGYLRVATTTGWWESEFNNGVYVLQPGGDFTLNQVGAVENIMPGEQIYAARFMGDKGYLVTFMQTDPLFTLDMSDPTAPALVGELEIPGFSSYIHPMDDNHLLTIGESGDEWGSTGGVALQIFDVSDLANPEQVHYYSLGDWSSSSEAQYNHKAFLYYHQQSLDLDLLVIPVQYWGGYYDDDDDVWDDDDDDDIVDEEAPDDDDDAKGGYEPLNFEDDFGIDGDFSGFLVFDCNADVGFSQPLFAADHTDLQPESGYEYYYWYPWPLRSAVIGEYLFTLSDAALMVSSLSTYESYEAIPLPYQDPYGDYYDDDDDWDEPDVDF